MLRQYELVDRVVAYDPQADEAALNRAYVFGTRKHGTQKRASGDPYFSHPIEVAGILTELRLDTATIITGLLHDTIEDTDTTVAEIEELFGKEVANLVDGVTKLSRLEWDSEHAKQAENFRKFLLAMSSDIRVLLVKLADRLHNMRTLHFISKPEKRQRIAQETMDIYAPLAGRMGMQEVREELEDLSFQVLQPEARATLINRLDQIREERSDIVERISEMLRSTFKAHGMDVVVYGREKKPFSVWKKMERRSISLEQLSDIYGFRVIVEDVADCYKAVGILHTSWPMVPGRFKDYISTPKNNGYRSIHTTIIGPERKRVEVQVRTRKLHEVAEYGIAAHWFYKDRGNHAEASEEFANTFKWLRHLVEMLEHGSSAEELLEHSKLQLFVDQVFCFTPKGLLITLPRGATPVDFAYAVHTDIGDTCVGCKINGRHMPLRTELKNGDEVEIIRSKAQTPSPAWEAFVATGKARSAIRRAARQSQQHELARLGRLMVSSVFELAGKEFSDGVLERAVGRFDRKDLEELLADVGEGRIQAYDVLKAVYPRVRKPKVGEGATGRALPAGERAVKPLVKLDKRMSHGAVQFAEGAYPLPGDRIVGILTPGEGVTVYPIDSEALAAFDSEPERWIDVTWDVQNEEEAAFLAKITLMVRNEVGALGSIATLIADYDGNIDTLSTPQRDRDFYTLQIMLEVRDLKHLTSIMSALRGLSVVNKVTRG
ncbi:RelA/SpoT family protein [Tepidicaulis sp.]|uniref:RelA/SpoT family protein n=1 Tax=Tepidicaulis sp. TaxID=1920809 RepID=UPI003B5AA233